MASARDAAEKACEYILRRMQEDPDVRYYLGPGTESYRLLCVAAAEWTGMPLAEVERKCAIDCQPAHRKREPEVLRLRKEIEALRG